MLGSLIIRLCNIYAILIFIYVLMSWIPMSVGAVAQIRNGLAKICDPYLNLFKKIVPPIGGMLDVTPIIALIVLELIPRVVVALL